MSTVGETIEEVLHLQLKQVVMNEVGEYLAQFIGTDSYEPTKGIASPFGSEFVSQNVVDEVKREIDSLKAKVEAKIAKLKSQPIMGSIRRDPEEGCPPKEGTKKAPRRAPPKRRKVSAKSQK